MILEINLIFVPPFLFLVGLCAVKEILEDKSNFISAMFQMDANESQTNNAKLLPMYYDYLTTSHVKVRIIKNLPMIITTYLKHDMSF